ncbi:hypothetical protein NAT51_07880 [Flavobacterium amniphilum]|uniref:hypothetical protein n=1 Tax=Flavobacterium amniphilum TaxID=1834035 RepID=UPI00202A7041|nr:hypothetical protein [Flavobacterium amniphilum]MCL9805436.1 hypothetical protein [Flavobacterium amniphilum]
MKRIVLQLLLVLSGWSAFSQGMTEIKAITKSGFYTNPVVSPSGKYALLTGEHFHGVYILELNSGKIAAVSKQEGSGYGYAWSQDSQSFYYKERAEGDYVMNSYVMKYDIVKGAASKTELNHNYLPSYKGNDKGVVVYTNIATLKIEAIDLATSKKWIVTNDEGQFYNAVLSHDGTKVAVHNGADIYVYPIDGSAKGKRIGSGLITGWSNDDKYLLGFLDESTDGHTVSNSELYLFDTEKGTTEKITATEKTFEMFPAFYGEDNLIFADDRTGQIFTSKIKF